VPVANQGQYQQYQGDEQQTGGLGSINRVPVVPLRRMIVGCEGSHGPILALEMQNSSNA